MQMDRSSKVSVAFLLSLGVLASLSACIRLKYTVNLNNSDDFLFAIGDVVIWGYAENGIGLIVGCISTLRPLYRRFFGSEKSSSENLDKDNGQAPESGDRYALESRGQSSKTDGILKRVHVRQNSGRLGSDSEEELFGELNVSRR